MSSGINQASSGHQTTGKSIKSVCVELIGSDGYYVDGIHKALLDVVPALKLLPQPEWKADVEGIPIYRKAQNEYFRRGLFRFLKNDMGAGVLLVTNTDLSVGSVSNIEMSGVPYVCFEFSRSMGAPEGFNVWYKNCCVSTFENQRLVCRGTFQLLPEYKVLGGLKPIVDWRVAAPV